MLTDGILVGLAVAAPIGPVNLICIQRTVSGGRLSGLVAGLGAVAGDFLFAVLAAAGLVAASDLVGPAGMVLQLAGAAVLIAMGLSAIRTAALREPDEAVRRGAAAPVWRAPLLTFVLTITNPATLLGFVAIFAGAGGLVLPGTDMRAAAVFVGGVAAGSSLWWLVLTQGIGAVRHRLSPLLIRRINQVSGLLILSFGLWLLARAAGSWFQA